MSEPLAPNVLLRQKPNSVRAMPSMNQELQNRFAAPLLFLLTVAAVVLAWINFQKERDFQVPFDGVWWVEQAGGLSAKTVDSTGPGFRAGIRPGDELLAVSGQDVKDSAALNRQLFRVGSWS